MFKIFHQRTIKICEIFKERSLKLEKVHLIEQLRIKRSSTAYSGSH